MRWIAELDMIALARCSVSGGMGLLFLEKAVASQLAAATQVTRGLVKQQTGSEANGGWRLKLLEI